MRLNKDLREFIELLNSHKVEYIIVGGHAVAFHGYPRFTGDIDFFIRPVIENGRRLMKVLDVFGFGDVGLQETTFIEPDKIIQLGRPPNRIDILTSISGITFDEAWNDRVSGKLDGIEVYFISRSGLIKNKRASGRSKDAVDLEKIESHE